MLRKIMVTSKKEEGEAVSKIPFKFLRITYEFFSTERLIMIYGSSFQIVQLMGCASVLTQGWPGRAGEGYSRPFPT